MLNSRLKELSNKKISNPSIPAEEDLQNKDSLKINNIIDTVIRGYSIAIETVVI